MIDWDDKKKKKIKDFYKRTGSIIYNTFYSLL